MPTYMRNLQNGINGNQRYHYNSRYKSNDRSHGNEKRKYSNKSSSNTDQLKEMLEGIMPAVKTFLESMVETQKLAAKNAERKVKAEERRAEAMEKIMGTLSIIAKKNIGDHAPVETARNQIVLQIQELRQEGMTYNEIALHLTKKEIPTFSGKGKWHAQTVGNLLKSTK